MTEVLIIAKWTKHGAPHSACLFYQNLEDPKMAIGIGAVNSCTIRSFTDQGWTVASLSPNDQLKKPHRELPGSALIFTLTR